MPPTQVVYLSRRDSAEAARELVRDVSPGGQLWLVVPWSCAWTRHLVSLKLLRRAAEDANVDLRVILRGAQARALGREAGLAVYGLVPLPLRRYRARRTADEAPLTQRAVHLPGRPAGYRHRPRPRPLSLGTALFSFLVIAGLLAGMGGAVALFAPRAEVIIEPVARPVSGTVEVLADTRYTELRPEVAGVPARSVQVIISGRGETYASGATEVADQHASGQVVVSNRTDTPVRVPRNTVLRTSSGVPVRFYTLAEVEVPGRLYATARVGIIAAEPGSVGNAQAWTINVVEGDAGRLVDVLNDAPVTGGASRRAAVVDYPDQDRLRAQMVQQLTQQAYEQLVSELLEGEFIPTDSLEVSVMAEQFDQVVQQQSDVVSMEMRLVARGLAIDRYALEEFATGFLEAQGGEDLVLIRDSLVVHHSDGVRVPDENAMRFLLSARGKVTPRIDLPRVKQGLLGTRAGMASDWIAEQYALAHEPIVRVEPTWWPYLPWLSGRLDVVVSSGTDT